MEWVGTQLSACSSERPIPAVSQQKHCIAIRSWGIQSSSISGAEFPLAKAWPAGCQLGASGLRPPRLRGLPLPDCIAPTANASDGALGDSLARET